MGAIIIILRTYRSPVLSSKKSGNVQLKKAAMSSLVAPVAVAAAKSNVRYPHTR